MEQLSLDQAKAWIHAAAHSIAENASALTELDTAIGDGDHGANMSRGFMAVEKKVQSTATPDIGALFKLVGMTLLSSVGGASGPLFGGFFLEMAKAAAGKMDLANEDVANILERGLGDIKRRGKAEPGDKTIVDALTPAVAAFKSAPAADLCGALQLAADAARKGAEETIPMQAHKGRASYLGERSIGHQDPGATSCGLLLQALASACASAV